MWRFIVVTFAFLGWSFYVLSGGADYEPRTQSIQARAKLDDVRPLARPGSIQIAELETTHEVAQDDATITRALSSLNDLDTSKASRYEVMLAAARTDDIVEPEFKADAQKIEILTQTPELTAQPEDVVADPAAVPLDVRRVTGTVVNMRDGPSTFYLAIGKLKQGDEVEVLETSGDGWLKIRVMATGQEGWMADWLATAAAN